jgi:hypothetical protein
MSRAACGSQRWLIALPVLISPSFGPPIQKEAMCVCGHSHASVRVVGCIGQNLANHPGAAPAVCSISLS